MSLLSKALLDPFENASVFPFPACPATCMRIVSLTTNSFNGGAAIVASSLSSSLSSYCEVIDISQDKICRGLPSYQSLILSALFDLRRKVGRIPALLSTLEPDIYKSYSFLPSSLPQAINKLKPDIVHFHWIQGEFLSIEDITRIKAPIVWSLHDCWPFSASEHHHLTSDHHYQNGYSSLPWYSLDKLTYLRKISAYKRADLTFVAPSQWIYHKASISSLLKDSRIVHIPNPVTLSSFYPEDKIRVRQKLGIHTTQPIFLAGSMTSLDDPVKGFDLLVKSLLQYREKFGSCTLLRLGKSGSLGLDGIKEIHLGRLKTSAEMRVAFSAADLTCIPSRIETHSQMAAESIACGTPVVAFNVAGNCDVISSAHSGILVPPFNIDLYCEAMHSLYSHPIASHLTASMALRWDPSVITRKYLQLYRSIIRDFSNIPKSYSADSLTS